MNDAAVCGLGLIYTVKDSVADELKLGKLEIVLDQFVATSLVFYPYYPQRSQVKPKLRGLVDHIKNVGRRKRSCWS